MKCDRALIERVAGLAGLELADDEIAFYETHMTRILDYVEQLDAGAGSAGVYPEGREPEGSGCQVRSTPEREDEVTPSLPAEDAVASAPKTEGTSFVVPRILE